MGCFPKEINAFGETFCVSSAESASLFLSKLLCKNCLLSRLGRQLSFTAEMLNYFPGLWMVAVIKVQGKALRQPRVLGGLL